MPKEVQEQGIRRPLWKCGHWPGARHQEGSPARSGLQLGQLDGTVDRSQRVAVIFRLHDLTKHRDEPGQQQGHHLVTLNMPAPPHFGTGSGHQSIGGAMAHPPHSLGKAAAREPEQGRARWPMRPSPWRGAADSLQRGLLYDLPHQVLS